ncbi:amidase family protein [Moniliophthora roreri MCA 2997]|uniref:Amidase family protein n=1 Tax=Moniliophthora roreri (strain MCA 2997) TaxID=1381753 RepID=V2WGQ8_MONRO|nr:amidase family protein [Moniliophthora roreri MCA 2997]
MPPKYSHVKRRTKTASSKKNSGNAMTASNAAGNPNQTEDHNGQLTQAMSAVSQLERTISRILLLRYEQDLARLFSTRLYTIALVHLPTFVMRCVSLGGPGWTAHNADSEEIKDFFRAVISMDMRQAGERVATKSILWSYTALRHFALSNNVPICQKRGLHSVRLLPHYDALKAHLDTLEAMPPPTFSKPPHLGPLLEGQAALEEACEIKFGLAKNKTRDRKGKQNGFEFMKEQTTAAHIPPEWSFKDSSDPTALGSPNSTPEQEAEWKLQVRTGYERVTQTLWRVAKEFDVRGYGTLLREKLTTKWCDCGCSTDHLGEVCERTVREEEEERPTGKGKQREWDGRGSGVFGWGTKDEEDIWEVELDFGGVDPEELEEGVEPDMTIGEVMELRYLKAEREKEEGNQAFRKSNFHSAIQHYEAAHNIEPELPHYQLNLAAAHLKLSNWIEAESACTKALGQHRSSKGLFRRAKARRMLGKEAEAAQDLRTILIMQPSNTEARQELISLLNIKLPPKTKPPNPPADSDTFYSSGPSGSSSSSSHQASSSSSSSRPPPIPANTSHSNYNDQWRQATEMDEDQLLGLPRRKPPKPLPFSKSAADERKLKIVLFPASFDARLLEVAAMFGGPPPSPSDFGSFGPGYSPAFNAGFGNGYGGPTGKGNGYALGYGFGNPDEELTLGNIHGRNLYGKHGRCRCGRSHGKKGAEMTPEEEKAIREKEKERIERAKKRQREMEKLRTPNVMYPSWERYIVKRADPGLN